MHRAFIVLLLAFGVVSAQSFTDAQKKFQQEMLQHHNTLRARHCAPAMTLDNQISSVAQKYAEELAKSGKFEHSKSGYGENLYMAYSSRSPISVAGSVPTQSWYDEVKVYNYNSPGFTMATGHFTQVVWKNSTRLGVGIAFDSTKTKAIVVANYSPPGNFGNQYVSQVARATC